MRRNLIDDALVHAVLTFAAAIHCLSTSKELKTCNEHTVFSVFSDGPIDTRYCSRASRRIVSGQSEQSASELAAASNIEPLEHLLLDAQSQY